MAKKNLLQLLGIAFVVALVATGLFYGLIAGKLRAPAAGPPARRIVVAMRDIPRGALIVPQDLKVALWAGDELPGAYTNPLDVAGLTLLEPVHKGEPVTRARLASADGARGAALGVPEGMRAVSVHVSEPAGVISMLRPGHRVDVQVVANRAAQGGEPALRTILQDLEVLASTHAAGEVRQGPVVTLLAAPDAADRLALADAAGSIRLLLRNPLDRGRAIAAPIALPALFRGDPSKRLAPRPGAGPGEAVSLRVQFAAVKSEAAAEIEKQLVEPRREGWLLVSPFRRGSSVEDMLTRLRQEHRVELLSARSLSGRHNSPMAVRAGSANGSVRIEFIPAAAGGTLKLRVQPEVIVKGPAGVSLRRASAEVEIGSDQTVAVTGLLDGARSLLGRMFPSAAPAGEFELMVFVTHIPSQQATLHNR